MIVGIDLGTTNSAIAVWLDGRPQLVPNSLGSFLTPSAVSVDEDGQVLVGLAARERQVTHPKVTATTFKIGTGLYLVVIAMLSSSSSATTATAPKCSTTSLTTSLPPGILTWSRRSAKIFPVYNVSDDVVSKTWSATSSRLR